jgi:Zn-dependent protease/CBS domain-containing protein
MHFTWALVVAVIIAVSTEIFPEEDPLWLKVLGGVVVSGLWVFAVALHEVIHGRIARKNGIHIKSMTLFVFGGVPNIVRDEKNSPWADFKVAIVGPLSSLAIGFVLLFIWISGWAKSEEPFDNPLFLLMGVFVALGLLNLLPGYPLDGGRALRAVLWWITGNYSRATHIASIFGQVIGLSFLVFGVAVMISGNLSPATGLWFAAVGWFLENGASASYKQTERQTILGSLVTTDVLASHHEFPGPSSTVQEVMQHDIIRDGHSSCPVVSEGKLIGIVAKSHIKSLPESQWAATSAAQVLSDPSESLLVQPNDDGVSLLERMDNHNIALLLVVSDGVLVGIVTRHSLMEGVRIRSKSSKCYDAVLTP